MQHVAASLNETMLEHPGAARGFCAFLRLRQGASERATWILEETPGGTMISVGSDAACDWQIRAAFVPARAFSLLIVGGRTFVRSGPEPGVLLDGKPVDDGWVQVPHGGRIDVGLARLEVTTGYQDTAGKLVEKLEAVEQSTRRTVSQIKGQAEEKASRKLGRTTMNLGAIPITPLGDDDGDNEVITLNRPATHRPVAAPRQAARAPESAPRRNATVELQLEDLYQDAGSVAAPRVLGAFDEFADAPQARLLEHTSGEFDVGALPHAQDAEAAPSLLDVDQPADKPRLWLYAVAGVVTAGAYGGWLILLDRF